MGQKVNPVSYRLQVSKDWSSKWFTKKADFKKWLIEDIKIREVIENRFKARPTIAKIKIERTDNLTTITILTAKAGAVIGKQGAGINELKKELEKVASQPIRINVEEVKKPELSAKIVALLKWLASQLWQLALKVFVSRFPVVSMALKCLAVKSLLKAQSLYIRFALTSTSTVITHQLLLVSSA